MRLGRGGVPGRRRAGLHRAGIAAVLALAAALLHAYAPVTGGPGAGHASAPGDAIPAGAYELAGQIVRVADGDTVTLLDDGRTQHRIRLDSIDAPEASHGAREPGQPFAEASRKNLAALVAGKRITARCYEADRYKREVCALMLEDGSSANRAQVAAGYAWAYTARRGAYLRDGAMSGLQHKAKQAGLGLWAQAGAVEPWRWRYDCWKQGRCE